MKKNFKNPELTISAFSFENIIAISSITAEQSVLNNAEFSESIGGGKVEITTWDAMFEL